MLSLIETNIFRRAWQELMMTRKTPDRPRDKKVIPEYHPRQLEQRSVPNELDRPVQADVPERTREELVQPRPREEEQVPRQPQPVPVPEPQPTPQPQIVQQRQPQQAVPRQTETPTQLSKQTRRNLDQPAPTAVAPATAQNRQPVATPTARRADVSRRNDASVA